MIVSERPAQRSVQTALKAAIFDVDRVLVASPHERAWREALAGSADPDLFTTALHQSDVAGKPRLSGARATLDAPDVADAERQAVPYAERKQKRLEELIAERSVIAFADALRFVQAVAALGWPMAVASSSKNANGMLRVNRRDSGQSLLDEFGAHVCGRDLPRGKPDLAIFLLAPRNGASSPPPASSPRTPPPASRPPAAVACRHSALPVTATRRCREQRVRIWW